MGYFTRVAWVSAVLGGLLVGVGCAGKAPWEYDRDVVGNIWPEACRRDLSEDPRVKAAIVARWPRATLEASFPNRKPRTSINGRWVRVAGLDLIAIADDLTGWRYDDALQHEFCHVVAGNWHPDVVP